MDYISFWSFRLILWHRADMPWWVFGYYPPPFYLNRNSIWSRFVKLRSWRRWKTPIRKSNPITHQWKPLSTTVRRQLTTPEKLVLNKGLNFATTIKRIPYLDIIASIEDAALKIPKASTDELRWKVRQVLEKSKPPKPNISKTERQALKLLQEDDSRKTLMIKIMFIFKIIPLGKIWPRHLFP